MPKVLLVSTIAMAALTVTACSNPNSRETSTSTATETSAQATGSSQSSVASGVTIPAAEVGLSFDNGVVRAMNKDAEMTAIFGTLNNSSDKDITVTGFQSSVKASANQIHEVNNGVMKEKEGGLVIPAGGAVELAPGGQHFMLLGVTQPVMAGDSVTLSVTLSDGTVADLGQIPVRTMGAGAEGYSDMAGMSGMASMTATSVMSGSMSVMNHTGGSGQSASPEPSATQSH